MKKVLSVMMTASLFAGIVHADENRYRPMAGVEVGGMESTYETRDEKYDTDSEVGWGLRGGVQNDDARIYASFHYVNFEDDKKDDTSYAKYETDQYDLLLNLEAITEPFRFSDSIASFFFIGAHIGGVYVDYDAKYHSRNVDLEKKDSEYGLASGAQAGAVMKISEKVELEAGYRYTWSTLDIQDVDLDHYDNLYIAFTYDF
ncbi:outer membrane beta-barrel protein [Hydrogenimonas sp.]|uniref:outer membrane beta-barrel protein n=1 Tax=Hydrogenimonas sp. TaxID=2231112 RepID=UPI00261A7F94|nr:outer membrane beta-barrel protein [Hydrogenimonas sp.]